MPSFTRLEEAALHAIFAETPDLAPALERQLRLAAVTGRKNTGGGFFTSLSVPGDVPRVRGEEVLGHSTSARVEGRADGLGFVLFLRSGRLHLLEAHAWGPESTAALDLDTLSFAIERTRFETGGGG